ncbi:MAG: in-like serine protease [Planctomycetota bacterium]|nr:in-like serine protease [Planctomycetota bacterium]
MLSGSTTPAWAIADSDPASSVLVRFKDGTPSRVETAVLNAVHAQVVARYPGGPILISTGSPTARDAALKRLPSFGSVRYAEPNSTFHIDATVPNDPGLAAQSALSSSSPSNIDANLAWDTTQGKSSTIIAVIDSGLDTSHPDFAGRLWVNAGEAAGPAGRDNDGDGFIGDVNGWNFINNSPNITDDNGHGTHVTGILGATGNNGVGVAGVNWNARIMPLKFIGADGNGSVDDAVRAIYYAVDHGARVINASWGGGAHVQSLTDAISYANSHNVVFVTAAGNEGTNNGVVRSFPADDRLPNLISVAAVDQNGNLASFSNFGVSTVDIAAPGINIRSTVPGGYATYSGTSMSAPYVSGVVSLLVGLHPEMTAAQLVSRVLNAAKPLPSLQGRLVTGGVVDAANTVSDAYAAAHPGVIPSHKGPKVRIRKPIVHKAAKAVKPRAPIHRAHAKAAAPVEVDYGSVDVHD